MEPKEAADSREAKDKAEGTPKDGGGNEEEQEYEGAPVNLKAQFLDQLNQENMPKALELCLAILEHEPENPMMLEYQTVLQQAISLAQESEDEESDAEGKEGKEDDGKEDKEDSEDESSSNSSDDEESSSSSSSEEEADSKEESHEEIIADLDLKIGEAEEKLFKKLADLRVHQEQVDLEESRLWESEASAKA
mmetsp:Transcript_35715/g.45082  ORF Transcript_35715/g.45082 Transcript_35715/m.45082 type:complete len:193 (+) Transcript_35715:35-613(+)